MQENPKTRFSCPCHRGGAASPGAAGSGFFVLVGGMVATWIKMRTDLARDPAVIQLAESYGWQEHVIVGLLHKLWSWADEQVENGNAPGVTKTFVDRYLGVTDFAERLCEVGWLECENGSIQFPHWERHMSQTAKRRALTSQRVAKCKTKKGKHKGNARSVTSSSLLFSYSELANSEKEPKIPDALATAEFEESWNNWLRHRSEIKKPLTTTQVTSQLRKMARMGESRAVAMIEHTIEKGWQGLREDEGNSKQPRDDGQAFIAAVLRKDE